MKIILTLIVLGVCLNQGIGQQIVYSNLEKLDTTVNSAAEEGQPILSPSTDTLFFFRESYSKNEGGEYAGHDIWYSRREGTEWIEAKNDLGELNNGDNNAVIGVNAKGNNMYLINSYSPPVRRNRGVAFSEKTNGTWADPKEVEVLMEESASFKGFFMHPDEDILVVSLSKKDQKADLYLSVKEAESWSELIHLGDVINSDGSEIAPFISANRDSLFFSSDRPDGLGEADIYVSKRLSDNWQEWSTPVNLGESINSEAFDAYYFQKNSKAWFSSTRAGSSDIYSVDISFEKPEDKIELAIVDEPESEPVREEEVISKEVDEEQVEEEKEVKLEKNSYSVYFAFDSDQLSNDAKSTLDSLITDLDKKENPDVRILLSGYADPIGPEEYNQILSERRNSAVSKYLIAKGISEKQIEEIAKGEVNQSKNATDPEKRAIDRRVDISLEIQ